MATDSSDATRALRREIDELARSLRTLRGIVKELGSTGGWFGRSNRQVLEVTSNLKHTRDMLGSMATQTTALARETEKAKASMEGATSTTKKLAEMGITLNSVADSLLSAGSTAAKGLGVSEAHKEVIRDEANLQTMQSAFKVTNADMKKLDSGLSTIARDAVQRREALIPALASLLAKGNSPDQALARLDFAAKKATAQSSDVLDAANAVGSWGERLNLNAADTKVAMSHFRATALAGTAPMAVVDKYIPELAGRAKILGMQGPETALRVSAAFQMAYKATGGDAERANKIVTDLLEKLASPDVKAALKRSHLDVDDLLKTGKDPLLAAVDFFQRNPVVTPAGPNSAAVHALDTLSLRELGRSLTPVLGESGAYVKIIADAKANPVPADFGLEAAKQVTQKQIELLHINMLEQVRPLAESLLAVFNGVLTAINSRSWMQRALLVGTAGLFAAGGVNKFRVAKKAWAIRWGKDKPDGPSGGQKGGSNGGGDSGGGAGDAGGDGGENGVTRRPQGEKSPKKPWWASVRNFLGRRNDKSTAGPETAGATGLSQAPEIARAQKVPEVATAAAGQPMSRREFFRTAVGRRRDESNGGTAPETVAGSPASEKPSPDRTRRKLGGGGKALAAVLLALTIGTASQAVADTGVAAATHAVAEAGRIPTVARSTGSQGAVPRVAASSAVRTVVKETAIAVATDAVADMALNRVSGQLGRGRAARTGARSGAVSRVLGRAAPRVGREMLSEGAGPAVKAAARSGAGRRIAFQGIRTALGSPLVRNLVFRGGVAGLGALATGPLLLGALGAAAVGTAGYFAYRNYRATGSIFRAPKKEPPAAPARAQAGAAPAAYAANTAALDRAIAGAVKSAAALSPMITKSLTGAAQLPRTLTPSFQVSSQLASVTGTTYRTAAPLPGVLMVATRAAAALPSLLAYAREAALRPGGSTQLTVHVHMAPGTSGDVAGQARRGALAAGPDMVKLINQTIDERRHREARTSYKTA